VTASATSPPAPTTSLEHAQRTARSAGFGNGLLLGYLMFRSGLVPRPMALIGLIGGPLAFATATAVLFGAYGQGSTLNAILAVPEIVWEASLGIWLVIKGFRPAPILTNQVASATR